MADPILRLSGVYVIRNIVNGKVYVGSSFRLKARWKQHTSHLKRHAHCNQYLQRSWDKHGAENFVFDVLEEVVGKANLTAREQYWMDTLNAYHEGGGLNVLPTASSTLGYKASAETRAKLSKVHKGRRHSPETRAEMTAARHALIASQPPGYSNRWAPRHTPERIARFVATRLANLAARPFKLRMQKQGHKKTREHIAAIQATQARDRLARAASRPPVSVGKQLEMF